MRIRISSLTLTSFLENIFLACLGYAPTSSQKVKVIFIQKSENDDCSNTKNFGKVRSTSLSLKRGNSLPKKHWIKTNMFPILSFVPFCTVIDLTWVELKDFQIRIQRIKLSLFRSVFGRPPSTFMLSPTLANELSSARIIWPYQQRSLSQFLHDKCTGPTQSTLPLGDVHCPRLSASI